MEFMAGLLIGALSGGFGFAALLRQDSGPRRIVVGGGRYMRAIARECNERYGNEYREATEAARNARGWR